MGLGNKNYDQSQKLTVLKIKTQDADKKDCSPYYQVFEKNGDKWEDTGNNVTSVSGVLTNLEIKEREFKGDIIKSVAAFLKDGNDTFLVDIRYSILGRSIINSLINIKDVTQPVEISLYQNKRGYSSAAVRSGDEMVSWKFSLDEQPKPEELRDKKGNLVKRDYTEVDEFFDKQVNDFLEVLGGGTPKAVEPKAKKAESKKKAPKEAAAPAEADDNDEALF